MNIERGAVDLVVGLGTSWLIGAYDKKRTTEGLDGIADVAATVAIWTGACTVAGLYLGMSPYIPAALSVFVRVGYESYKLYNKFAPIFKKEKI